MLNSKRVLALVTLMSLMVAGAVAQTPAEQAKAPTPSPASTPSAQGVPAQAAPSSTPQTAPAATVPSLNPKDLQGLDVFASGGQQLGTVTNVSTLPDGKVKAVELKSAGFLGMFKTTYVVPVDKFAKKGSRIELSMTGDQAKQFIK